MHLCLNTSIFCARIIPPSNHEKEREEGSQSEGGRQGERRQKRADSLPGSHPCDHPSRRPDRQHALSLLALQVKKVSGPLPSMRASQQPRNNYRAPASGPLGSLLHCCDSTLCFTWSKNISGGIFELKKFPSSKLFGTWSSSISHVLKSVQPGVYKNTCVIPPQLSI